MRCVLVFYSKVNGLTHVIRLSCWSSPLLASRLFLLLCLSVLTLAHSGYGSLNITLEDLESAAVIPFVATPANTPEFVTPETVIHATSVTAVLNIEKPDLKFGSIKLTDCASLVIAKEKGFFDAEGLNVELEAQANWKVLLDGVINGQLDGAHMLAGQTIGATIGIETQANFITAYSLDYNGNGITLSNEIWAQMQEQEPRLKEPQSEHPITAASLKPIVDSYKQEVRNFSMGIVLPVSTHNYEIRYWLAAAGIKPGMNTKGNITGTVDADVLLSVTRPPEILKTFEAKAILGYCVGETWNQLAVVKGIGVPVTTNYDIWKNNPAKVFGITEEWNTKNPNTRLAIAKALIQTGKWLEAVDADGKLVNGQKAAQILSGATTWGLTWT